jgi:hypothetical protein
MAIWYIFMAIWYIFMAIWYIFMAIWYIFTVIWCTYFLTFGLFYEEKSGNPGEEQLGFGQQHLHSIFFKLCTILHGKEFLDNIIIRTSCQIPVT